jgi:DNA-binding NarL/FixJ family response regulator
MSESLKATIVDVATGETTERPLTADEIADRQAMTQVEAEREAEAQAKADARESALAKLAALGLTQDEINAL